MTGANRLLIGVAWALIATLFWLRFRRDVELEDSRRMELFFLGLATAYAFLIPLKGTLAWYDGVVFLGIYVWYLVVAARRPVEEVEPEGPAELFARLPKTQRRLAILSAFLFAGCAILASAEPSAGSVAPEMFRINEFVPVRGRPLRGPEFTCAGLACVDKRHGTRRESRCRQAHHGRCSWEMPRARSHTCARNAETPFR